MISDTDESKEGTKKMMRDPLSHRLIEKRRRDRMNNCLADLNQLIPACYLKKSRGRVEKTEIIEMAIRHVKHLEAHNNSSCRDINRCDLNKNREERKAHFKLGYQEATSEVMRFLVEFRGFHPRDELCNGVIKHLDDHLRKILNLSSDMNKMKEKSASFSSITGVISSTSPISVSPKLRFKETLDVETFDSQLVKFDQKEMTVRAEKKKKGTNNENATNSFNQHSNFTSLTPSWDSSISSNSEINYPFFKKIIKERFQSDILKQKNGSKSVDKSVQSIDLNETEHGGSKLNKDLNILKYSNIFSSDCEKIYNYKGKIIKSVPAFALHPNGSFYIPITLNPSLISFFFNYPETNDLLTILHPVNIPVNFNYICSNKMHSINNEQNC